MNTKTYISQCFTHSKKSQRTQDEYKKWVLKLCQFSNHPHPLDVTVDDIAEFYVSHYDKGFALTSLEVIRAAIKYFYTVLLRVEVPEPYQCTEEFSEAVKELFVGRRRHKQGLPEITTDSEMAAFLDALPDTNAGRIIVEVYRTGKTVGSILEKELLTVSKGYLQQVAARVARQVGIEHGFGLRGVRATGIVHRIQNRKDARELVEIFQNTGLSYQQFLKYRKVAGDFIRPHTRK